MRKIFLFKHISDERGQTAILSVIFFTILMMVLTVSFMRVVTAEQAQTTNTELNASALAAAESGVEDAKRVISYCRGLNPSDSRYANCQRAIRNSGDDCTAVTNQILGASGAALLTDMSNGQVRVGTVGNQYYTCMVIDVRTPDYVGTLPPDGKSVIVPMNDLIDSSGNQASPSYIAIQWHSTQSENGDGPVGSLLDGSNLPNITTWNTVNRPAVLRSEVVRVPNSGNPGSIVLGDLVNDARAVTLRPTNTADSTNNAGLSPAPIATSAVGGSLGTNFPSGAVYDLNSWTQSTDPNDVSRAPLQPRNCSSPVGGYQCYVIFGQSLGNASYDYYLRLQSYYRSLDTHFRVTAYGADGGLLYFMNNPSVDVTGRTANSYARLVTRLVSINVSNVDDGTGGWYPDYAIDSGDKVCKNMTIAIDSGTDNCVY